MTDLVALESEYNDPSSLAFAKMKLASQLISGGVALLDVGCGTGELMNRVAGRFDNVFGIDVTDDAVGRCLRRFAGRSNVVITKVSVTNLEARFTPETFEWVAALDIIEHLEKEDAYEGLRQIARVLKPGGRLLLTAPNWYDMIRIGLKAAGDHRHAHSSLGWMRLLRESGLRIERVGSVRFPLIDSRFLRDKLHYFGMCVRVTGRKAC